MHTDTLQYPQPPRRRSIWPFVVVGLLAGHVTGMVIAVVITQHDKTFLVVPDYYDKAQHWDSSQAERRASASLGWSVQIEPGAGEDERGNRAVRFVLADAQGRAVPAAALEVNYFHHAHPDQQHKILLRADGADARTFQALLPMPYAGIWEFHFVANGGQKTFVQTQTQYIVSQRQASAAAR